MLGRKGSPAPDEPDAEDDKLTPEEEAEVLARIDRVQEEKRAALLDPGPTWREWFYHDNLKWWVGVGYLILDVFVVSSWVGGGVFTALSIVGAAVSLGAALYLELLAWRYLWRRPTDEERLGAWYPDGLKWWFRSGFVLVDALLVAGWSVGRAFTSPAVASAVGVLAVAVGVELLLWWYLWRRAVARGQRREIVLGPHVAWLLWASLGLVDALLVAGWVAPGAFTTVTVAGAAVSLAFALLLELAAWRYLWRPPSEAALRPRAAFKPSWRALREFGRWTPEAGGTAPPRRTGPAPQAGPDPEEFL